LDFLQYIRGNLDNSSWDKKFIYFPNKEFAMAMPARVIAKWVELDNKEFFYQRNLIYRACVCDIDVSYIKWMILQGFKLRCDDTRYIAINRKWELLYLYHERGAQFNLYVATEAVKAGRLDILEWLYSNNYVNTDGLNGEANLMKIAFERNYTHILAYLKKRNLSFTIMPILWINIFDACKYEIRNHIINDETLKWMWKNGYTWTYDDAELCQSKFMADYIVIQGEKKSIKNKKKHLA